MAPSFAELLDLLTKRLGSVGHPHPELAARAELTLGEPHTVTYLLLTEMWVAMTIDLGVPREAALEAVRAVSEVLDRGEAARLPGVRWGVFALDDDGQPYARVALREDVDSYVPPRARR